jgi:hypothetical protein
MGSRLDPLPAAAPFRLSSLIMELMLVGEDNPKPQPVSWGFFMP